MKRVPAWTMALFLCLTALIGAAVVLPVHASEKVATTGGIQWQPNLQTARKTALAQGKPILIVFGADWCAYCKKLDRQTLNAPAMVNYINQNFVTVYIDSDKDKRVTEILEVQALPCSVVITPDAELLGRINGYLEPGPFQKRLMTAHQGYQPIQPAAQAVPKTVK